MQQTVLIILQLFQGCAKKRIGQDEIEIDNFTETPIVNFTNILQADFWPTSLH